MRFVAMIRNVMVGREGLDRETLLSMFRDAGAEAPHSHLATGNVTFSCAPKAADALRTIVEVAIAHLIGRNEPVILRPADALRELVQSDPFAAWDATRFTWDVTFLDDRALPFGETIRTANGLQVVELRSHDVLTARTRDTKAPHALPIVERTTGAKGTTRAWSTVLRLANAH